MTSRLNECDTQGVLIPALVVRECMYEYVNVCMYIGLDGWMYTYTHTHTPMQCYDQEELSGDDKYVSHTYIHT